MTQSTHAKSLQYLYDFVLTRLNGPRIDVETTMRTHQDVCKDNIREFSLPPSYNIATLFTRFIVASMTELVQKPIRDFSFERKVFSEI